MSYIIVVVKLFYNINAYIYIAFLLQFYIVIKAYKKQIM